MVLNHLNHVEYRYIMKTGPKYKICKRLGSGVFEKCQTQKFLLAEERRGRARGRSRPRALSDYGRQLLEKQKVRFTYGLAEKQLAKYVKESTSQREQGPDRVLIKKLESRLDNAIYRAGLASTRSLARQIASHGHITVNGRRVTIPSYSLSVGDVIAVREGSRSKKIFENLDEKLKEYQSPKWINFDPKKMEGSILEIPDIDITLMPFDLGTVLEYYSR